MDGEIFGAAGAGRRVVLLQGPASWFFAHLSAALRALGAEAERVLLCPGDWVFSRGPARAYRGAPEGWAAWLRPRLAGATDLVCLGDGRFWHRTAIAEAEALGVAVHVVEQGYLRPGWITVEPRGIGARSAVRRGALAGGAAPASEIRAGGFANYAAMDVAWNLANLLGGPAWPHYRRHALDPPLLEWAGWAAKALGAPLAASRARAVLRAAVGWRGPVFLLPLQLETDFQIRRDGPEGGMTGALNEVVASFAAHAPSDALLVVKRHPLDHGAALWARRVRRRAASAGVPERVRYLAGGDLGGLLRAATGVVTVNSTVGLSALRLGRPVKALGAAIYDRAGLAHGGPLAGFWRRPEPPDPALVARFVATLAARVQMPGAFDGPAARTSAEALARRILLGPGA